MVPYKCCSFSARSAQGQIQGGVKIGHGGPFLQETSSSDRKATAINQMDSNDLEACGKKCCYFFLPFRSQILKRFWRLLDLVIFFHVFTRENAYIKDLNAWRILMNFHVFI